MISNLNDWYDKPYGTAIFQSGLEALADVYSSTFHENQRNNQRLQDRSCNPKSPSSDTDSDSDSDFYLRMFLHISSDESDVEDRADQLLRDLDKEVRKFTAIVRSDEFQKAHRHSNRSFWKKHMLQLPRLYELVKYALNMPCSSAAIDRFFNICQIRHDKRDRNSCDENVITKSTLATNVKLLEELTLDL